MENPTAWGFGQLIDLWKFLMITVKAEQTLFK